MTKLPGRPFIHCCRTATFAAKARLVKRLAAFSATLFQHRLHGIGNIYPEMCTNDTSPDVDRIVSMDFFWGGRIHLNIDRGPFHSSKDWLLARLLLSEHDCRSTLATYRSKSDLDSDDESDIDDATRTMGIIEKLKLVVPLVFSTDQRDQEPSMLLHDDLSRNNVLTNDDGELSGILGWECVSALPLWKACDFLSFLEGPSRDLEPEPSRYHPEDDGEPSELYWEHMWDYEATLLRKVYLEEMKLIGPKWVDIFNMSTAERDLDIAVQNCSNEFISQHINAWIADVTAGETKLKSLRDRIDES